MRFNIIGDIADSERFCQRNLYWRVRGFLFNSPENNFSKSAKLR
jgi:hypothetical protein